MPQMAPMNWILLYIYFFMILIFITIFNYYMFLYKPKFKMIKSSRNITNWKW
uniref:ATP synthase F0 subunit 8 n=1 Tax=Sternochetus olivieri TaxID=2302647 RepID=UPI002238E179|nr:ATP synthase F0 subunit 8 [Sternochetus olivieri]UYP50716.1 ATP synthase F0 subunit 8 [Sternochetus olivieri]